MTDLNSTNPDSVSVIQIIVDAMNLPSTRKMPSYRYFRSRGHWRSRFQGSGLRPPPLEGARKALRATVLPMYEVNNQDYANLVQILQEFLDEHDRGTHDAESLEIAGQALYERFMWLCDGIGDFSAGLALAHAKVVKSHLLAGGNQSYRPLRNERVFQYLDRMRVAHRAEVVDFPRFGSDYRLAAGWCLVVQYARRNHLRSVLHFLDLDMDKEPLPEELRAPTQARVREYFRSPEEGGGLDPAEYASKDPELFAIIREWLDRLGDPK